jgi:F420H(2)-dependent quinone reductase
VDRSPPVGFKARARAAEGAERDRLFAQHAAINPGFSDYQKRTSRVIPVVVLERIREGEATRN